MIESLSEGNPPDLRKSRLRRAGYSESAPRIERLPPHSPEAERGLLGCILIDAKLTAPQVSEAFPDTDGVCYSPHHSLLLRLMLAMFDNDEPVDMFSVLERLRSQNRLDEAGGLAYISELPDATPSSHNVQYFIDTVRDKMKLRNMLYACTNGANLIYGDDTGEVEAVLDRIEKEVLQVRQSLQVKACTAMRDLIPGAIDFIETCHQNQGKIMGLATGLSDLDTMTGGLQNGFFYIVAGLPSQGKSALALNIVEHIAISLNTPVGVFSLEMTDEALAKRSLCTQARINMMDVRHGKLVAGDFPRLTAAALRLKKAPIFIDDTSGLTVDQLRSKARVMKQKYNIRFLLVDYLQLLRALKNGKRPTNRQEEVAEISQGLKGLAKDLDIPVMALSQVDRKLMNENRKPTMADLRESGAMAQDADFVGILHRAVNEDEEVDPCAIPTNLNVEKQREGPTGPVRLIFLPQYTKFEMAAKIDHSDVPNNLPYND